MKREFTSLSPQEALHVAVFIEERNAALYHRFAESALCHEHIGCKQPTFRFEVARQRVTSGPVRAAPPLHTVPAHLRLRASQALAMRRGVDMRRPSTRADRPTVRARSGEGQTEAKPATGADETH